MKTAGFMLMALQLIEMLVSIHYSAKGKKEQRLEARLNIIAVTLILILTRL